MSQEMERLAMERQAITPRRQEDGPSLYEDEDEDFRQARLEYERSIKDDDDSILMLGGADDAIGDLLSAFD